MDRVAECGEAFAAVQQRSVDRPAEAVWGEVECQSLHRHAFEGPDCLSSRQPRSRSTSAAGPQGGGRRAMPHAGRAGTEAGRADRHRAHPRPGHRARPAASLGGCGVHQRAHIGAPVEAQQGVFGAHRVVDGTAVVQPEVGRPAAGHGRWRELVHAVRRRRLAVVGDEMRAVVEVAEVQSGAAVLLDVQVVQRSPGRLADLRRPAPGPRCRAERPRAPSAARAHGSWRTWTPVR